MTSSGWDATRRPDWPLGAVLGGEPTPRTVHDLVRQHLATSPADAWLFWDSGLGVPDPARVQKVLGLPGHLWHAGLRLGTGGRPGLFDFTAPTWMLNRDPSPDIEATSWRLSLRACLVRTSVLRRIGGVWPGIRRRWRGRPSNWDTASPPGAS